MNCRLARDLLATEGFHGIDGHRTLRRKRQASAATAISSTDAAMAMREGVGGSNPLSPTMLIRLNFILAVPVNSVPTTSVLSAAPSAVVACKRCRRVVPLGREEFPFLSIAVTCR